MTTCLVYPVGSLQPGRTTANKSSPSTSEIDISMTSSEMHERVKRPMNAFMVWSTKRRKELARMNPKMHNSELSKRLGIEWSALTEVEKMPYITAAQKIREKHRAQHPGYRYPTTKRRRQQEAMLSMQYHHASAARMARMGSQAVQMLPPLQQQHMGAMADFPGQAFTFAGSANQPLYQFPPRYNQHSITVLATPSSQAAPLGYPALQHIPPNPAEYSSSNALSHRKKHAVRHLSGGSEPLATTTVDGSVPRRSGNFATDSVPRKSGNPMQHAIDNPVIIPLSKTSSADLPLVVTSSVRSSGLVIRPPATSSVSVIQSPMTSSAKRIQPPGSLISDHTKEKLAIGGSLPDVQSPSASSTNRAVRVIQRAKTFADSSVQVFPVQQEEPEASQADHSVQVIKSPRDHTVRITLVERQADTTLQPAAPSAGEPVAVPEDDSVQIVAVEHHKTPYKKGRSGASSVITPLPLTPIVKTITPPSVSVQSDGSAENSRQQGIDYAIHKAILLSSYRAMRLSLAAETKLSDTRGCDIHSMRRKQPLLHKV